jgi:hypothetical protein
VYGVSWTCKLLFVIGLATLLRHGSQALESCQVMMVPRRLANPQSERAQSASGASNATYFVRQHRVRGGHGTGRVLRSAALGSLLEDRFPQIWESPPSCCTVYGTLA